MVQLEQINAGDVYSSARLFDAEVGHFGPTLRAAQKCCPNIVENSSLGAAQIDHFRLVDATLLCCTAAFLIESRP